MVDTFSEVRMRSMMGSWLLVLALASTNACEAVAPVDAPATDFRITMSAPRTSMVEGDTVRFTIRVTNLGPNPATGVIVRDSVSTRMRYTAHTVTRGAYESNRRIWTVGSLMNDSSATMTLLVYADTSLGGTTDSAGVVVFSTDLRDTLSANNVAILTVQVTPGVPPSPPPPPPPPSPPPAGLVFSSSWSAATGAAQFAVTDGGAFNDYYGCSRSDVLSVIAGSTVGWTRSANVLRVQEIGNLACGAVQKTQVVPVSTTHWGRMYFRNDETTQNNSFHNFAYRFVGNIQLVWFNRRATATGFEVDLRLPAAYPFNIWRLQTSVGTNPVSPPIVSLTNGAWFRYEWQLEYISATRVRFWPRLYNDAGTLLHDASNFYQVDAPASGTATLASWYAAGNSFVVSDLQLIRDIGVGNEGRAADVRPGQSWYIGNFAISTAGWIGQ